MFIRLKKTTRWVGFLLLGMQLFLPAPASAAQEKSDRKVIKKVEPAYPPFATQLRLSGSVKMVLQITREGKVESVHTIGGNPVLAAAAEAAVKQWKYEAAPRESSEMVTITFEAPK